MVVNDSPGEECRIAILENGHLEELYAERTATATNVGNIYKGRVTNVESAIQAAFIDYGQGANGFLHISDLHPRYFPGAERTERVGKKIPRRERPPISEALKRGDEVLVQVLKEGIGTKGPTLTSYLSVPGRLLVLMPDMDRVGVSRKVEDEDLRREMRKILDSLTLPGGFGFILRTAGFGRTKTELKRDVAYLMRLWKVMEQRLERVAAPCELYTESDLLLRTIRDVLRPSISAIVVDSESAYKRASTFLGVIAPRSAPKIVRYRRPVPIFHAYDIERQIDLIHSREVPLPSGGRLVIDQTEALVAIDVNSGKSRSARDSEANAFETNCEAVDEICRQLRLRDLGGLVVNDLIDMRLPQHRRKIEERFRDNLKRDRAKTTTVRISRLGLLEMTRQRMRPSLHKSHFIACPQCRGHGEIQAPESLAAEIIRQIGYLLQFDRVHRLEIACSPRVASVLLSSMRRRLVWVEEESGKSIDVRVSDAIPVDRVDYYAYDDRNADINMTHLPALKPPKLADLEKDPPEGADERPGSRRSRRRRSRKGGPADAAKVALMGDFADGIEDEEDELAEDAAAAATADGDAEEVATTRRRRRRTKAILAGQSPEDEKAEAEGKSRRKRRRRRPRKSAAARKAEEAAQVDAPEAGEAGEAEEQAPPSPPLREAAVRVYVLAKELDVKSREILDRCAEAGNFELKNHMSSLSPEQAAQVEGWFAPSPPEAETEQSTDNSKKRSSRRRRGRRGGRSRRAARTDKPAAGHEADQAASADAQPAENPIQPTAEVKKKSSKRKRRSKRSIDKTEQAGSSGGESSGGEFSGGESSGEKGTASRTGRRTGRSGAKPTDSKVKTEPKADKSAEPSPAATLVAGSVDQQAAKTKPRRTLYRSRSKVRPTTRVAAHKVSDE